jgi:F-type H+-transporting ATPase subunit epsilon
MKEFHLQIATPDGIRFDGAAESLLVKCESGDVEIMAGHADLFASLGIGRARIKTKDGERTASCAGGFLTVSASEATMIATTLEFADEIDVDRALAAKAGAE